jgi:hypothetical protein
LVAIEELSVAHIQFNSMRLTDGIQREANLLDDGVVDTLGSVGATSAAHTSVRLVANYGFYAAKIKPQAEHRTGQTRLHPRPRRRRARTALPPSRVTPQRRPASSDRCDVAF